MVFVIVVDHGKAPVAIAFIQRQGAWVVGAHFKAQVRTSVRCRAGLGTLEQLLAQPNAAYARGDSDGIQARARAATPKQHQCIAEQLPVFFRHQQLAMGAADHPLKTTR